MDSLCGKLVRVKKGVAETKLAFDQLTQCLEASLIDEWTSQEQIAINQRGDQLNIIMLSPIMVREYCISILMYILLM